MRTNNDLETRVSALEELSLEIGQECNRSLDLTNKIVKNFYLMQLKNNLHRNSQLGKVK